MAQAQVSKVISDRPAEVVERTIEPRSWSAITIATTTAHNLARTWMSDKKHSRKLAQHRSNTYRASPAEIGCLRGLPRLLAAQETDGQHRHPQHGGVDVDALLDPH